MKVERISIDEVHADPGNVRLHDERNMTAIASSLKEFGQQKPIVVDANGRILAGNGTWAAAKTLGWRQIAVVRSELVGTAAVAYAIADNRTNELSAWDDDALASMLRQIDDDAQVPLTSTGFDDKALAQLLKAEVGVASELEPGVDALPSVLQLVVDCADASDQQQLYERLTGEGYSCRVLTL